MRARIGSAVEKKENFDTKFKKKLKITEKSFDFLAVEI